MSFKLRILSIAQLLHRNLPVLFLVLVIVCSFNSAVFLEQALSGWLHNDRLLLWVSSVAAALCMFGVIVNSISLFATLSRAKANG